MSAPVAWVPRDPPLAPCAVVAEGPCATALAERLLAEGRDDRRGLASPGERRLLVVGDDLPWVDGVRWLGVDPAARGLFLPTTLQPTLPVPLLAEAVRRRVGLPAVALPGAVWAAGALGPLQVHRLAAWRGVHG